MKLKYTALACLGFFGSGQVWSADKADILFLIDQSISMAAGLNWVKDGLLANAPGSSNSVFGEGLSSNGVSDYRFGLVRFTGFALTPDKPTLEIEKVDVGSGDWGSADKIVNAVSGLQPQGDVEDGYAAIDFALKKYSFRNDAAVNLILITNEDRDAVNADLKYAGILDELKRKNAKLNVVVNAQLTDSGGKPVLGLSGVELSNRKHYGVSDDGSGYSVGDGGKAEPNLNPGDTTVGDYVDLALKSGGAAWDLNRTADNPFTQAFVDVKAAEIKGQPPSVPIPAALPLFSFGVAAIGLMRRKMTQPSRSVRS